MTNDIRKIGEGSYLVPSDTSTRSYQVTWGIEGDFYSCTCTSYAVKRNKAGGLGHEVTCKHIDYVLDFTVGDKAQAKAVSSLQSMIDELSD